MIPCAHTRAKSKRNEIEMEMNRKKNVTWARTSISIYKHNNITFIRLTSLRDTRFVSHALIATHEDGTINVKTMEYAGNCEIINERGMNRMCTNR